MIQNRKGESNRRGPFVPPEDWYEPSDDKRKGYELIEQPAGRGFKHVVTGRDVQQRLDNLPSQMTESLEVVQLSRMTRKKRTFPCYGMQWGTAIYLYPIEESLVEYFYRAPTPAEYNETRMFGGRWKQDNRSWRLVWTPETIRDYYLNNVLIHELGHLLDDRNSGYADRERFAEWFAVEHGYRSKKTKKKRAIRRRHG